MEATKRKPRNSHLTGPTNVDEARKMARLKSVYAAPLWGMTEDMLRRRCIRGEIPGAVRKGQEWWVTPQGMDAYFEPQKKKGKGAAVQA